MNLDDWKYYAAVKPEEPLIYQWRFKHEQGFFISFYASMISKKSGLNGELLSPKISYWDGYKQVVPEGLQWRLPEDQKEAERREKLSLIEFEDIHLRDCPFCGKSPEIRALHTYNEWQVRECCSFIGYHSFTSPYALEFYWNGYNLSENNSKDTCIE